MTGRVSPKQNTNDHGNASSCPPHIVTTACRFAATAFWQRASGSNVARTVPYHRVGGIAHSVWVPDRSAGGLAPETPREFGRRNSWEGILEFSDHDARLHSCRGVAWCRFVRHRVVLNDSLGSCVGRAGDHCQRENQQWRTLPISTDPSTHYLMDSYLAYSTHRVSRVTVIRI